MERTRLSWRSVSQCCCSSIVNSPVIHVFPRLVRSVLLLMVLFAGAPLVLADDLPDLGESARAELSPQVERRIGENIMNEIRLREPSYVDDPEINDYLNNLGRRLAEASANPTGDFNFFAIRDNTVNAFAMLGGFIGVNTGTILTAQTESELALSLIHISEPTRRTPISYAV